MREQVKLVLDRAKARPITWVLVILWISLSLITALTRPFGSYQLSFASRLFYWSFIVAISILLPRAVTHVMEERFPDFEPWKREILSMLLYGVILTACITGFTPHLI